MVYRLLGNSNFTCCDKNVHAYLNQASCTLNNNSSKIWTLSRQIQVIITSKLPTKFLPVLDDEQCVQAWFSIPKLHQPAR